MQLMDSEELSDDYVARQKAVAAHERHPAIPGCLERFVMRPGRAVPEIGCGTETQAGPIFIGLLPKEPELLRWPSGD